MRRPRGPGGRFLSASEMAALEAKEKAEGLTGGSTLSFEEQTFPQSAPTPTETSPKTSSPSKEKSPTSPKPTLSNIGTSQSKDGESEARSST